MTTPIDSLTTDTSVAQAAQTMRALNITALPVNRVSDDVGTAETVGMITDRDIVMRVVAEGRDPAVTTVQEVMTPHVICCFENTSIEQAAELMVEKQVHRLVVLNQKEFVTGVLSLHDLAIRARDDRLISHIIQSR